MKLKQLVEAALFVSTNPLSLEDLCKVTGCETKTQVRGALESIKGDYDRNRSAIEIKKVADDKYIMQVKDEFAGAVSNLVEPVVAEEVLRTLSLIALRQPITQADTVKARGYLAYDHVRELANKEFIYAEPKGRTKILSTTPKFSEYFGLMSKDPAEIKRQLENTLREL